MLLDEVKATLAIENLNLSSEQEKILKDYADGVISFEELKSLIFKLLKENKAAWILEASTFDEVYCYKNSEILKNNFNETDPQILSQYERMFTGARLVDLIKKPLKGNFDLNHLKKIHHYIFQDVYPWAGELRRVNISKEILFCDVNYIQPEIEKIFEKLKSENYLRDFPKDQVYKKAAYYLGEINAIHPFREGNGRAQREFIRELLIPLGLHVDYSLCSPEMMLHASIESFAGDYHLMEDLFFKCIKTIKQ